MAGFMNCEKNYFTLIPFTRTSYLTIKIQQMTKTIFFGIAFLFLNVATIVAQPAIPKDVNSLYKRLVKSGEDTVRVRILIDISRYDNAAAVNQPTLLNGAFNTATQANSLAQKLSYPEGLGLSYQAMAHAWCTKKDFTKSNMLIKKAIDIFLQHQLYRDAAEAYLNEEEFFQAAGGTDFAVRIAYYEKASRLFHQARAYDREGAALSILGDFYQVTGNRDTAFVRLNAALVAFKKVNYRYLQATYDLLNAVNAGKSRYNDALKYGLLAAKTAEDVHDTTILLCTIYNRLGSVYGLLDKFDLARSYFEKAIGVAEKYKDVQSIKIVMTGLTDVLIAEEKPRQAIVLVEEMQQRFAIKSYSKSWYYAISLAIYTTMKNNAKSQQCIDSLLKTDVLTRGNYSTIYAFEALTMYYTASRQYKMSQKYLPEYIDLAKKLSLKRNEYVAYYRSFLADSAQKNYLPAINNYRLYFALKDSLYDVVKAGNVEELRIKYETEENEKSIAGLTKDASLQRERVRQANITRNITIAGAIVLLILVGLLYRSSRINKQNIAAINSKNTALNQLITEKEWLIKEIHHRVKNNLQIVMGLLQRQSAFVENENALAAIQSSENRMHSIALIHQKLYQADNLNKIGMGGYIDEMINYMKDSYELENRIFFETLVDDIYMDVTQAVPLGLILNEAITNTIKYAYPGDISGTVYISMIKEDDQQISLTIADNGPGLPQGFDAEKSGSLGLNLMKGLSKQLGGTFEIVNEQGCLINIIFRAELFGRESVDV